MTYYYASLVFKEEETTAQSGLGLSYCSKSGGRHMVW